MGNIIKNIIVLITFILSSFTVMAQREKNYIYLFDCTGSMKTNGLWETAQIALDKNILLRTVVSGSHFTVIPFGDNPYETFSFIGTTYPNKRQDISNAFANNIKKAKFTHISDVLKSGFCYVDAYKDNEIYLFTDGEPNGGDSPQKVAETINEWCANHRNAKLFYVALTKGIVNPAIKQAIDACGDASIVQCENGIVPVITDISTDVYTNLEELDNIIELLFSVPGDCNLTANYSDELFDFYIVGDKVSNGKFQARVSPKGNLTIEQLHQALQGNEYVFPVTIQCTDQRFTIANPTTYVHISDEVPIKLTIAHGVDEMQTRGVKWFDSFLWSDAAPDPKVVWDIAPVFKNELQNSYLELNFQVGEGQTHDFQAWYNGQSIKNGSTIKILPNQPSKLEVQFNYNASTGKRYFLLIPTAIENINFINEHPSDSYIGTSLRTEYNVEWNPLKTFLFWFAIIVVALLSLWFVIFKRIFFPTIRMGKIGFTGPGTYYGSKKIKGARKVILTSKRKSQNIISRIFTGEIRFIIADHFSPELSITPITGKRKIKIHSEGELNNVWDIYPSSIFVQYDKGCITNRTTNEKSEIYFS